MTLTLAPVAAVPAFAVDVEGGGDIALEQHTESDVEKDVEQNVEAEKDAEQTGEVEEGEQQSSPEDDAAGSGSISLMSATSSTDTAPVVEQRADTVVTMAQGDGEAVQYGSIADALANVKPYDYKTNKDVYTITLVQNVTEDVTIPAGVNVTIDLAGHTLKNASGHTITNRSTKTVVTDSVGGGVVDNVSHGRAAVYNDINASVTLKGGTFSRSAEASTDANSAGGNSWYVLKNFGTMTISDGVTVKFSDSNPGYYSSLIGNGWQNSAAAETGSSEPKPSVGKNKATLTINGGNFVGGKITVKNDDYGVLTVKGGSISQDTDSYYAIYNANKATVSGGTISALSDAIGSEHYDGAANDGSLTVSGGTITSRNGSAVALLGGAEGTIKGGTFQGGSGQYVIDVDGSSSAAISAGTFVCSTADKVVNKAGSFVDRYGVVKDANGNLVATVTDAQATVTALDGTVTSYESLSKALSNAPVGSTVTLQEDVNLTSKVATKNFGVTLDLNGHNVISTVTSDAAITLGTNYGAKPVEGVDSTMRLVNGVSGKGGEVRAAIPLGSKAGDSTKPVALEVGEGVTLVPDDPAADAVKLESSAYLRYSERTADYIKNGGFRVSAEDGDRIYGTYANAAGASVDGTVTMLHDYAGTAQINSGDHEAVLDLGGHTYTYTGGDAIAEVNYDGASLTIKNGALTTTSDSADGVVMLYSNSALALDGVEVEVPKGSYGIVTNGQETNNAITLRNSELTVTEGAGIYFPSTGSVTIDDSVITAKTTGVQLCAGNLTVQGDKTAITVTGQPAQKTENDGVIPDGAAISIVKRAGYQDLGTVSVKGGTFTSASRVDAIKAYEFSNDSKHEDPWDDAGEVVAVSGGSFSTSVPQDLCADGLEPVKGSDDSFTVGVAQDKLVTVSDAQGNVLSAHDSLSAAIAAAGEGQTVALLGNVTESVTIPEGKNVTLDLAGNTLTNTDGQHTVTVNEGATLTVTDSSEGKTGVIDNVSHGRGALVNHGTVTVESGTLTRSKEAGKSPSDNGGNSWYVIDNQGTMTFDGGAVTSKGKYSSLVRNLNGTLTINDGEFKNGFIALKNDGGGVLEITGGTITSDEQAIQNWSKAEISGGTLNGPVIAWDYGEGGNSETTVSDNAVINSSVTAVNYMNAAQGPVITIAGGTITGEVSKGTHDGTSGIQVVDPSSDTSQIVVSSGTFEKAPADEFIVLGSGLTKNPDGTFGIHEHVGTAVVAKEPTCTETGNEAHWVCSECGELFADEEMTQPTTLEAVTIGATGHQSVTHVAAKDATETEAGNREYWHCTDCGRYFLDEALTKETTLAAVTIPAKGQEPVETHTVTLVLGTGEPDVTIEVADGESLPTPAVPTYPGYTFLAWYTDAGLTTKYDLSLPVTGDLTLYAGWTKDDAKEPTKPEASKDKGDEKDAGLAKTGDATTVAPLVASAMAGASALAVGAVTLRRRNR